MSNLPPPPLTDAHIALINAGFRPRRHSRLVSLSRRLLWPIIRPFHFYVLERLLALENGARREAPAMAAVPIGPGTIADLQSLIFSHAALRAEVVALTNRQVWVEQTLDSLLKRPPNPEPPTTTGAISQTVFVAPANDGVFILRHDDPACEAASHGGAWGELVLRAAERAAGAGNTAAADIGAGVGLVSVPLARRFSRVISFETSGLNLPLLRANAALNGQRNIEIHDEDVASAPGKLDSLALPDLAFLNIDAPDTLGQVLMGAMETIGRCRPWVVFASNASAGEMLPVELDAVSARLTALGYNISPLPPIDATRAKFLAVPHAR